MKRFFTVLIGFFVIFNFCACGDGSKALQNEIAESLENHSEKYIYSLNLKGEGEELLDNKKFNSFIIEQANNLIEEEKYDLLLEFLDSLAVNDYMDQTLDDTVLEKINLLDLDTRVEIAEMHTESAVKYYLKSSLITGEGGILKVDDIEKYVEIHGEEPLYFMNDEGGYYDNDENKHQDRSVYWGSGGLTYGEYARSYFTYRGDFAVMETYGTRDTGTEEGMTNDYEVNILFKGGILPYRSEILKPLDCVYSNGYLFIPEDERVYVYNVFN